MLFWCWDSSCSNLSLWSTLGGPAGYDKLLLHTHIRASQAHVIGGCAPLVVQSADSENLVQ